MSYEQSHIDIKSIISSANEYIGKTINVCGWIRSIRKTKKLAFVVLYDGTSIDNIQIIFSKELLKNRTDVDLKYFDNLFSKCNTGTSLQISGLVVSSIGKEQLIEIQALTYNILGNIVDPETYPIAKTELTMDYLRTVQHLRIRTETHGSIARIKSTLKHGMTEYLDMNNFTEVQVPLITDNECESGANPFTVTTLLTNHTRRNIPVIDKSDSIDYTKDFFNKHCYLTVSGQLHLEALVLGGLSKAYTMTTAFRAEPSTGPRHLAEFWMLELELCGNTLEDNMKVNEGCIKHALNKLLSSNIKDLEFLENKFQQNLIDKLRTYANDPFVFSTHEQCVRLMLADIESGKVLINPDKVPDSDLNIFREVPTYDGGLSKDHERYITEVLFGGMPVFVRYFPAKIKAFYMPKIDKGNEIEHVDCFDLLFPVIGEIVGGSQRISDYNELIERMAEMNIDAKTLEFYTDLRKYGTIHHGGSGIGVDRLLMVCTGIFNIRDLVPFPRSYGMCNY